MLKKISVIILIATLTMSSMVYTSDKKDLTINDMAAMPSTDETEKNLILCLQDSQNVAAKQYFTRHKNASDILLNLSDAPDSDPGLKPQILIAAALKKMWNTKEWYLFACEQLEDEKKRNQEKESNYRALMCSASEGLKRLENELAEVLGKNKELEERLAASHDSKKAAEADETDERLLFNSYYSAA